MTRGRCIVGAITATLTLMTCGMAQPAESADFKVRRPTQRVIPAHYRMQAEPTESAAAMPQDASEPQDGDVIYEGMTPEEIDMYGESMPGPYAAPPEGGFPYPKLYNLRPHRSHGSFAPQSNYYGYYPTCWRRWPEGWGCPSPGGTGAVKSAPTKAEELPAPEMPAPGTEPTQPPAEEEYGPVPGEQAAPGGMAPDEPTTLPEGQLPEQPMPLEEGPPEFPTDELEAPGLPSNGGIGLPNDNTPTPDAGAAPGGLPAEAQPSPPDNAAPGNVPQMSPPPGLPTETPAPGLPSDDSLPPLGGQLDAPPMDELPEPGQLKEPGQLEPPPPAEPSDKKTGPGFGQYDDAPPRFDAQDFGLPTNAQSMRSRPQGPRLSTGRPAPAMPHTASVAGHQRPIVDDASTSGAVDDGPSLWPAPGESQPAESATSGRAADQRTPPDGLRSFPDGVNAAPVNGYGGPDAPSFPQPGDTSQRSASPQRASQWEAVPSTAPLRSQAMSQTIDRAVRPTANWADDGSANVVAAANQPLATEADTFGTNPLRAGSRTTSTTPPRRLPTNMRANPLR